MIVVERNGVDYIFPFLKTQIDGKGYVVGEPSLGINNLIDKSLGEVHFFTSNEPARLAFFGTKPSKKQVASIMVLHL